MKVLRIASTLVLVLSFAAGAFAQSRGSLRVTGRVLDEAGQPVAEAVVRAAKNGEAEPERFDARTNSKGEYTIRDVAAGEWVIEAVKEGVGGAQVVVTLDEAERTKTVDITIAKPEPTVDPSVEINAEHQRAIGLAQSGKIPEARKIYEDLLAKHPTVHQLHAMLAGMHAAEGNAAKGLEHIRIALEKEPENADFKTLAAELMMETGDKEGAAKLLQTVDIAMAKEARAFTNLAINHINAGKHAEAIDLLTKLIAQFPDDKALLYYRGRAYIAATKLPEAKVDLDAFVAAAPPEAPQLPDAKKLLEQLNKKV
jgi:predicted Zn-dependent protease